MAVGLSEYYTGARFDPITGEMIVPKFQTIDTTNTGMDSKSPVFKDSRVNIDTGSDGGFSWDKFKGWFTPQGESGVSQAGSVLSNIGTGVNVLGGLASMYYGNKEAKLKKESAEIQKDAYRRSVAAQEADERRREQFAKNAGNNAVYKV